VVALSDGDTLTILDDSQTHHKIRLAGIDAPEKGQAFGTKSREALASLVFGKAIRVDVIDIDRYRREVGRIYVGSTFVSQAMVRNGFAWRYPQYDKAGEFTADEEEAREHKRGLWADPHPVPPWEYRREKRSRRSERKNGTGPIMGR
jgi:micrococcal nuclease